MESLSRKDLDAVLGHHASLVSVVLAAPGGTRPSARRTRIGGRPPRAPVGPSGTTSRPIPSPRHHCNPVLLHRLLPHPPANADTNRIGRGAARPWRRFPAPLSENPGESGFEPAEQTAVVFQPVRHEVYHLALAFDGAVDREQAGCLHFATMASRDLLSDHDVDVAGLVFQGHENEAARGGGALAADDEAGGARRPAVRDGAQVAPHGRARALRDAFAAARGDDRPRLSPIRR